MVYFDPFTFDWETWSYVATIWGGFGTLAIIPSIQLIRKRQQGKETEKKGLKDSLDDLVDRVTNIEVKVTRIETTTEEMRVRTVELFTDVRVLEAIADHDLDLEKTKGRKRKQDDSDQHG